LVRKNEIVHELEQLLMSVLTRIRMIERFCGERDECSDAEELFEDFLNSLEKYVDDARRRYGIRKR